MKRLIAWMLCLALLICGLSACGDKPQEEPDDTTKQETEESEENGIRLSRYTIVYPQKSSVAVRDAAEKLAKTVQALTTDTVKIITDDVYVKDYNDQREILIGATNRDASKAYYGETPSYSYEVFKREQKIVLAGYTDALTVEAISYFTEEYVNQSENAVISPVSDHKQEIDNVLSFSSDFRLVYQKSDKTEYAYFEEVLSSLGKKIQARTGKTPSTAPSTGAYEADRAEILIGRYPYIEFAGAYDNLQIGGYSISVLENKILFAATSKLSYEEGVLAFDKLLAENTLYGTKEIGLVIGTMRHAVGQEIFANLPVPSVSPKNVLSSGDSSQVAIFEQVTEEFFTTYTEKLLAAGFTEYSRTSFNGDGAKQKNLFGTYVSETNTVDIGFHENFGRMYLSVSPKGTLTLPNTAAPEYTAVDSTQYPTILTQVGTAEFHKGQAAMCYLLRIADGSFILYDTSYGTYNSRPVAEELYKVMKKQAPDPSNIVISAIILTHPHGDHIGGFVQFAKQYANAPSITVKQIVYNFPDVSLCRGTTEREYLSDMSEAMQRFGSKVEIVKPRAGNVLHYADVKFNVLYTHENYLGAQDHFDDGNTMTMVTQMVTADDCKVLFGGDHPVKDTMYEGYSFCEGALHRWYGSFLESYVVTMFHHGLGGGADDFIYPTIKPKIVLWPGIWDRVWGPEAGKPYKDSAGNAYSLDEVGYNQYFSAGLEPDMWHETPNARGVHAWYVADDGVQILTFSDGKASVATYDSRSLYVK